MFDRSQAKLITIYENFGVFIFSSPSGFNAIHAFNLRFHILQKCVAIFLFQFLTSYSMRYPFVKKLHRVPYLAFITNYKLLNTTTKSWTTADRQ